MDRVTKKAYLTRHVVLEESTFLVNDQSSSLLPSQFSSKGNSALSFLSFSLLSIDMLSDSLPTLFVEASQQALPTAPQLDSIPTNTPHATKSLLSEPILPAASFSSLIPSSPSTQILSTSLNYPMPRLASLPKIEPQLPSNTPPESTSLSTQISIPDLP